MLIHAYLFFTDSVRRYAFPHEPSTAGVIDLTSDEHRFYFNPYSGDMSLQFPKAERRCKGGILAYALSSLRIPKAYFFLVTVCLIFSFWSNILTQACFFLQFDR